VLKKFFALIFPKGGHNKQLLQKYIAKRMGAVNRFFAYLLQKGGHNKQLFQKCIAKRMGAVNSFFTYLLQKGGHNKQLLHVHLQKAVVPSLNFSKRWTAGHHSHNYVHFAKGQAYTFHNYLTYIFLKDEHAQLIHQHFAKGWACTAYSHTFCMHN
jgi:hypothetical protein